MEHALPLLYNEHRSSHDSKLSACDSQSLQPTKASRKGPSSCWILGWGSSRRSRCCTWRRALSCVGDLGRRIGGSGLLLPFSRIASQRPPQWLDYFQLSLLCDPSQKYWSSAWNWHHICWSNRSRPKPWIYSAIGSSTSCLCDPNKYSDPRFQSFYKALFPNQILFPFKCICPDCCFSESSCIGSRWGTVIHDSKIFIR